MKEYYTKNYRKKLEANYAPATIERIGFGEKDYLKKYGQNSLFLNNLEGYETIMQLDFGGKFCLINISNRNSIKSLEKQSLENKIISAIIQNEKVVGIKI